MRIATLDVSIAPPEYVIVRKLQYAAEGGGDRHLRDIKRMLERALVAIDHDIVRAFAEERGLLSMWTTAASAPPQN